MTAFWQVTRRKHKSKSQPDATKPEREKILKIPHPNVLLPLLGTK